MKKIFFFALAVLMNHLVFSQNYDDLNTILTAVPFLNTTPSAEERGMGEIGVVTNQNNYINGHFQNPALLSRNKKVFGAKASYMPWQMIGQSISDIVVYYSINKKHTIAGNLNYFDINSSNYDNNLGTNTYEFSVSIKYAQSFSEHFSSGITLKYVESNIFNNSISNMKKVKTLAGDIGFDYRNQVNFLDNKQLKYDIGFAITNLGPKVSYSTTSKYSDFIPTNLKLGILWTYEKKIKEGKQLNYNLAYQAEKLLVPTPEIYQNGLTLGMDNNVSALKGIFQSFYDAPHGFEEEINEILHKFGTEVQYKPKDKISYALRAGYFSEHLTKGNRKYGTVGTGLKYKLFYIDLAYIIASKQSLLSNTFNINIGIHKVLN